MQFHKPKYDRRLVGALYSWEDIPGAIIIGEDISY
tara:strand:- start:83 stop:187 length:105 start_codon:yes stop_codon:yes gene_type:complete